LKESFVENGAALVEASQQYIMVSIDGGDNDDLDQAFKPDGSYVPRVMMATSSGELRPELTAPDGNPKFKYFYTSADQARPNIMKTTAVLKCSTPEHMHAGCQRTQVELPAVDGRYECAR
jgi:protein-disulfide reductase (glutathione)